MSVHPRGRGEQLGVTGCVGRDHGSSPRARGTASSLNCNTIKLRFIPAGAGNSSHSTVTALLTAVHPRGRGEQKVWDANLGEYVGSSPRTRGTALPIASPTKLIAVHPRGRGEQVGFVVEERVTYGSSPRTRGTENGGDNEYAYGRFIPADAGNRVGRRTDAKSTAVHPRGRGEQLDLLDGLLHPVGSSPRTRGTV